MTTEMFLRDGVLLGTDGSPVTQLTVPVMRQEWYQPDGLGLGYDHPDGLRFATADAARSAVVASGNTFVCEE